jgi:signal transduction histidine kinase
MSLRGRLLSQFALALLAALLLQAIVMLGMTRQTVHAIVEALGGLDDPLLVERLLERWRTVQWMYVALSATLVMLAWAWIVERTIVRPLRRLEDDLERFSVEELAARLEGDSDLQRLARGIERMTKRAKEHGEKLEETEAQLTRAEQLAIVGRLSAGLAHEIGNPLGAVIGYLALLKDEGDPGARKDIATRAEHELQRINGLVRELLDYARPAPLKREKIDALSVVKAAAALLSHQPRGQRVRIAIDVAADVCVMADPTRLQQIFLNIFLNGADAMNGEGELIVRGTVSGHEVRIEVRDHGPGFTAEALLHAGEPFFTTKGPQKGTGLGLAVCQTLIREQGGALSVQNADQGGAIVSLTLPAA